MALGDIRNDWTLEEIQTLMNQPFNDLIFQAQTVHRQYFDPNEVQTSTLVNIKTGGCAEDCAYCSQSARNRTEVEKEHMMDVQEVIEQAVAAREKGATRLCMGAAWRNPGKKDFPKVLEMVRVVKNLGLETCLTLGMLSDDQVRQLKDAGLDYYNHNLDTSEAFYPKIITTRNYQDRLDTIDKVQQAGIHVCSGGIIGMGEAHKDRAELIRTFATLRYHPDSVPINLLVPIEGTPLAHMKGKTDSFEFIRVIAAARITMPKTYVRLSAGRMEMPDEAQALCFLAGANSIFYGDKLLTTENPEAGHDERLFARLGIHKQTDRQAQARAEKLAAQITELTA
ncbi:MAG: biotin synthase BioB [Hydrogenovibrio sp.]|uniref:biotin synthase BioB n=1 Tax=Hydrogenovibrio sp. TaxID=2065821 RepID=UPI002870320A|nr:biotin synthase BioB [Hydrogenovibrio sp.]MDR9498905.1 biotin synthase BioB [Hydrogenovibrio sp.]